ncbi:GNAT family N-acetyltransferase [uncultured Roseobacter sp.]|uniref:GNAT family N-acetyltransferase n=1 Tax=uncultured Roseobacter sp. TaxID=114847 RepID=UPI0026213308|nr:GNAT family N-acetyltransferase [uncultured Roseobacter sp.]
MRRMRPNLITQGAHPDVKDAIAAREANLLGKHGPDHAQDAYIADANQGDLVVPTDALSEETQAALAAELGEDAGQIIGRGGEIDLGKSGFTDGLGLADPSDTKALLALCKAMHAETDYRKIPFSNEIMGAHIIMYLDTPATHRIFVHKEAGRLQGALFGHVSPYFFSEARIANDDLLYVAPEYRSLRITRKLIKAFEVWAMTCGAQEICLSVSTGLSEDRAEKLLNRQGFARIGAIFKKQA